MKRFEVRRVGRFTIKGMRNIKYYEKRGDQVKICPEMVWICGEIDMKGCT